MNRISKILITALVFSLTVILAQESLAAGFKSGNEFQVNRISGHLTVYCTGGGQPTQNRFVRCNADLWSPGLSDYFVGPQVDADEVTLSCTRADGSERSKDSKYDGATGQSKKAFNLGIWTLTQKPLLLDGVNQIHYTLTKDGSTVTEGDFTANVVRGPSMTCPSGVEHGFASDCDFPEGLCDRYFQRYNYCQ